MIDWNAPIEPHPPSKLQLVARDRVETEKMSWVQIVGGEEGWDGWFVCDDGTPKFQNESYRPLVRNWQVGAMPLNTA